MRVLHVSSAYPPATAWSGAIEQLHALVREQRRFGVDARVVTTDADETSVLDVPTDEWTEFEGVPVYYARCWNRRFFLAPTAWPAMRREAARSDLLHLTQVWSWLTIAAAREARRNAIPLAVTPHGGLDPHARALSRGRKGVFRALGGDAALRSASGFQATSERERAEIEAFVPGVPVAIIPNGVSVPSDDALERAGSADAMARKVLFLGRLSPLKNLPFLLRCWREVRSRGRDSELVIAGPDERGHRGVLEKLAAELGVTDTVRYVGKVAGEDKLRYLKTAWCLVLPSLTENFGNVVAEALACGTPVIASTGTPWSFLPVRQCGWWVPAEIEAFSSAMVEALRSSPEERAAMGRKGRRWMQEEFAFGALARRLTRWYERLLPPRAAPS